MVIETKIEEFTLDPTKSKQTIEMPIGSSPLSLKMVGKTLVIFAFVPFGMSKKRNREVQIFTKGQVISGNGLYIDTVLMDPSSALTALHIFIDP